MIISMNKILSLSLLSIILFGFWGCGKNKSENADQKLETPRPHSPYTIADSSKIKTETSGLKYYIVEEGPGDYPEPGSRVLMDYIGILEDGTVFDNSYERAEPFAFTLGRSDLIMGMAEGVSLLRYGSRAILIVPPSLGYKDEEVGKIPPNSTLYFHVEILGSF